MMYLMWSRLNNGWVPLLNILLVVDASSSISLASFAGKSSWDFVGIALIASNQVKTIYIIILFLSMGAQKE